MYIYLEVLLSQVFICFSKLCVCFFLLQFFRYYHAYQGLWNSAEPAFQCIGFHQSWWQGPKKIEN